MSFYLLHVFVTVLVFVTKLMVEELVVFYTQQEPMIRSLIIRDNPIMILPSYHHGQPNWHTHSGEGRENRWRRQQSKTLILLLLFPYTTDIGSRTFCASNLSQLSLTSLLLTVLLHHSALAHRPQLLKLD